MTDSDSHRARLERLRQYKNPHAEKEALPLDFLRSQFKKQIEKPYKQLGALVELWQELVPEDLAMHTKLDGLRRGVLRVTVDSSSRLYELDRLLRGGVESELVSRHRGTLLRVQLRVGEMGAEEEGVRERE